MVLTTAVDGDNKPNRPANWTEKPKFDTSHLNFTGAAKSDSAFYQKVITTERSQDGQLIAIVESLPSYIGAKRYTS